MSIIKSTRNTGLVIMITVLLLTLPSISHAQAPKVPTMVEVMAGHERLFYQMVVKKKFSPDSKFGFLNVSTFTSSYRNDLNDLELVMPVLINYNFYNDFSVVAGTTINSMTGFSPVAGLQHSYGSKKWVAVSIASFFLNSSKNIELFGIYEYKPRISDTFTLYTRLQYMYLHNFEANYHARSFMQLRTGLIKDAINFGLGANLDQYGPEKFFRPNYGVFVGWAFP